MLGRTLGGATVAVFQGTIILGVSLLIGFRLPAAVMLLPAILCMLLIAILFTALGTSIASVLEDMHGFQLIMNFLIMPLFFLSGALFPLHGLPRAVDTIVRLNPLTYGVDGLRGVLIGQSQLGLWLDLGVLAACSLVLVTIGGFLFSRIQHKGKEEEVFNYDKRSG